MVSTHLKNYQSAPCAALFSACFLYSCLYPAYKNLEGLLNPTELIVYRCLIALPILAILNRKRLWGSVSRLSASPFDIFLLWIRAWLAYGVAGIGFAYAVMNGSLVSVALISNVSLYPLWGWVLYREKLELREVGCFVAGLTAVLLLVIDSWTSGVGTGSIVIAVASNLSLSFVISAQRLHRIKLTASEWSIGTLFFGLVLALVCLPWSPATITTHAWSPLSIMSLLIAGVTLVFTGPLVNYASQKLKSYTIGQVLLLEIPLVGVFDPLFYGKLPSGVEVLAVIVIVGAVYSEKYRQDALDSHAPKTASH